MTFFVSIKGYGHNNTVNSKGVNLFFNKLVQKSITWRNSEYQEINLTLFQVRISVFVQFYYLC